MRYHAVLAALVSLVVVGCDPGAGGGLTPPGPVPSPPAGVGTTSAPPSSTAPDPTPTSSTPPPSSVPTSSDASRPPTSPTADLNVSPSGSDGGDGSPSAPFGTIQRALDVAGSGDVIALAAGEYRQDFVSRRPGVTVRGPRDAVVRRKIPPATATSWCTS